MHTVGELDQYCPCIIHPNNHKIAWLITRQKKEEQMLTNKAKQHMGECHRAYQLIWLQKITVSLCWWSIWSTVAWQHLIGHLAPKRQEAVLSAWDKYWSQRLVSSQLGSFMFFKTLLMICSNSFLARCSSSSVLLMRLLSLKSGRGEQHQQQVSTIPSRAFCWKHLILLQQWIASMLINKSAHLFELLNLIF